MAREDTGELLEKTKIESAIYRLKDKGSDINPYSVAEEAGLERSVVSRDRDAMELIIEARGGDVTFEPPNSEILRRCNELDATILEMENENNLLAMKVSELEDKLLQAGTGGGSDDINEQVKALLSSESDVQVQQMERELEAAYAQVVTLQEDNKDLGHSVSGLERVNEALNARLRELEEENKSLKDAAPSSDDSASSGKDDGTSYTGTDPDELVSANREMKRRIKDLAEANRKQLRRIKDLEQSNAEATRSVEAAELQKAELQQEAESLGAQLSNTWNVAYQKGFSDADEKAKKLISESQAKMQNDLQSLQYIQAKSEAQFQIDIQTARADAKARAAEVEMLQSEITALRQALSQTQTELANIPTQQQQAAAAPQEQYASNQGQPVDEQMLTGELVAYGSPNYPAQSIGSEPARGFTFAPSAEAQAQVAVAEVFQDQAQVEPLPLHAQFQEDLEIQEQLQEEQLQVQMQAQLAQSQPEPEPQPLQEPEPEQEPELEPTSQQETLPPPSHYQELLTQQETPTLQPPATDFQPQAQPAQNYGHRLYDPVVTESGGQEILNFARTGPYVGGQSNPLENMSWRDLETVYSMGVLSIKDFARNIPDPYKREVSETTGDAPVKSDPAQKNHQQNQNYEQPPVYGQQDSSYEQPPFYGESLYEGKVPAYGEQYPQHHYQQSPAANPYAAYAAPDNGGEQGYAPGYGAEYSGQDYDNQGVGAIIGAESITNTSESAVMDPTAYVDQSGVLDLDQLDIFEDLEELEDLSNIEIMADDPLVNELLEPDKGEVSTAELQRLVKNKIEQTKDMNEQAAAAARIAAASGNGEEKTAKLHKFVGQKAQAAAAQAAQDSPPPPPPNPHAASNFVRAKPIPPEIKKHLGILGLTMETLTRETVLKEWKAQAAANHPDQGGNQEVATAINQAKLELMKYLEKNEPKLGKKFGRRATDQQPDK